MKTLASVMEPRGPAPGGPAFARFVGVNADAELRPFHGSPAEVKRLDQKVRPSFNKYICIPSYPGHMPAWRSAVMAGQVSRQMRK